MSQDQPDDPETGAEGDASNDTSTPFTPREDDDSPLGSTDQHSQVDHSKDPADGDPDEEGRESFPASDPPANY